MGEVKRSHGRVSLSDVAVRAGVSPATASRSLRGLAKVSPDTRQRVIDAARELSYETPSPAMGPERWLAPDSAGSALRPTVAVIVPFVSRWFFGQVTSAAVDLLRERGYDVLLYHLGRAERRDQFFERMPLAGRVEGVLTLSTPLTEEHTLALRALDIPLVSVGSPVPGWYSVGIDDAAAARSAVNHLLHLKHEQIGFIAGEADDPLFQFASSAARRQGCEEALNAAGLRLDPALVASGPSGVRGGAEAMAQLLARPKLPTAVFAEYDELAIGAVWALRRAGLTVPGDVSVVGVDDHEMAAVLDLTTVAQRVTDQGRIAAEMLLQVLSGDDDGRPAAVVLPTHLVLRGSTAPPAAAAPAATTLIRRRFRR